MGCEFDCYGFLKQWEFITKENAEKHINKAFSQIHKCFLFTVTGHIGTYKEEGYYPKKFPKKLKKWILLN